MGPWSVEFLRGVLDASPDGVAICKVGGPDSPVVYVNEAFERLCGYSAEELIGQDLRRLQSWDRDQECRAQLREAIASGESCRVTLRNYRKDGSQFWNEVLLQPMRGTDGLMHHIVGYHRDVSERERSGLRRAPELRSWQREDRMSGLCSRAYFEELLQHDWQIGVREGRPLTLLMFDIDQLGSYNDTYGRAAGDACIRRIAGVVGAAFRRGSDVVARWEGGCVVALVRNTDLSTVPAFADGIAHKVLGQRIHHPRAAWQKFVTVSIGAATLQPSAERTFETLVQAAVRALRRAKEERGTRVAVATPEEMN